MGNEDWRLRRADELFGSGQLRPRELPPAPVTMPASREAVAPAARFDVPPPSPADRVTPAVTTLPIADTRSAYRTPPVTTPRRRRAAWRAALLAVAGLIVGVLIGWLAHSPARIAVVAAPRIAASAVRVLPPHVATPVQVPLPQPVVPVVRRSEPVRSVVAAQVPPPPSRPARTKVVADTEKRPAAHRDVPIRTATRAEPPIRRARSAAAPSYDCRRNRGTVLRAICGDPALATLDRQLSARFAALDASSDPATVQRIHRGETAFLNDRQSCPDRACLIDAYRSRLRELDDD